MKRKRQAKNVQSLKKVASSCSSDTFHSKITTKFQTLFNGFVSELQSISEDKRPDVTLLFSPGYSVSNSSIDSSTVPSLENSCLNETTIALQNFIDSAKSKLPSLLSKGQEDQNSHRVNLLKSLRSSATTKTIRIDPLQIQISLKLQSLLCKALDSKKSNTKNGKSQSIASKGLISETDWQDLSLLLQDFTSSAKQKLSNSLAKNCNGYQVNVAAGQQDQNSTLHSSQPCDIALPSSVSHTVNKEFLKLSQKLNSSPEQVKSSKVGKENLHSVPQPPSMDSSSESGDGFDNPDSDRNSNEGGGIMLLHEAERAPEYLELELETDSDTDNPPFQTPVSESDEEVIVLGEKRPTYQEITLEEDDEGEVHESVIEKELQKPAQNEIEELLLNCPKCGKGFRVESLLKFHLRMHGTETPLPTASEQLSPKSSPRSEDDSSSSEKILNTNQSECDSNFASQDALNSGKHSTKEPSRRVIVRPSPCWDLLLKSDLNNFCAKLPASNPTAELPLVVEKHPDCKESNSAMNKGPPEGPSCSDKTFAILDALNLRSNAESLLDTFSSELPVVNSQEISSVLDARHLFCEEKNPRESVKESRSSDKFMDGTSVPFDIPNVGNDTCSSGGSITIEKIERFPEYPCSQLHSLNSDEVLSVLDGMPSCLINNIIREASSTCGTGNYISASPAALNGLDMRLSDGMGTLSAHEMEKYPNHPSFQDLRFKSDLNESSSEFPYLDSETIERCPDYVSFRDLGLKSDSDESSSELSGLHSDKRPSILNAMHLSCLTNSIRKEELESFGEFSCVSASQGALNPVLGEHSCGTLCVDKIEKCPDYPSYQDLGLKSDLDESSSEFPCLDSATIEKCPDYPSFQDLVWKSDLDESSSSGLSPSGLDSDKKPPSCPINSVKKEEPETLGDSSYVSEAQGAVHANRLSGEMGTLLIDEKERCPDDPSSQDLGLLSNLDKSSFEFPHLDSVKIDKGHDYPCFQDLGRKSEMGESVSDDPNLNSGKKSSVLDYILSSSQVKISKRKVRGSSNKCGSMLLSQNASTSRQSTCLSASSTISSVEGEKNPRDLCVHDIGLEADSNNLKSEQDLDSGIESFIWSKKCNSIQRKNLKKEVALSQIFSKCDNILASQAAPNFSSTYNKTGKVGNLIVVKESEKAGDPLDTRSKCSLDALSCELPDLDSDKGPSALDDSHPSDQKNKKKHKSIRKEKENSLKCSPKLSFNKKSRRDKYRKRRSRDVSKCFL